MFEQNRRINYLNVQDTKYLPALGNVRTSTNAQNRLTRFADSIQNVKTHTDHSGAFAKPDSGSEMNPGPDL